MLETGTEHHKSTGHGKFDWSIDRDRDYFKSVFGYYPSDNDPLLSIVVCMECGKVLSNR